jgi:hypothetical protein
MLGRLLLTFVLAVFVPSAPLAAQAPDPGPDAAPAHVALVEGAVTLEREGRAETAPLNMPLLSGDRLRTGADGRVEVLFADGSTLHLDMRSTIDVQSDDLVRLTDGRLRLNILGPARTVAYRIDSPAGSARITEPGEYRIALVSPSTPLRAGDQPETQLEVAVVRGAAEVFTDQGSTPVRAGERAYASADLAPSYAYAYNSANWDAFDRWSEARRDVRLGVSSQYLPSDMQAYAPELDQDGDWRYTQSYGYAWYPRVAADWRPYYNGRWASYPRYGWTWIGAERFAWPTHHYGRWGVSAGVWFWIPSSRWAPAYVSWGYAPGYVSWCPLGFDNRPVIAIDLYRVGRNYYSPWRAWTSVASSHFGARGDSVNQRAVNWDRFDRSQRPRFETRPSAPGFSRDIAVPRSATPIRWAGSSNLPREGGRDVAVPRTTGGSAASRPARDGAGSRYVNRGDEIIRSQTERPTPRAGVQGAPSQDLYAVPRSRQGVQATPGGPARNDRGAVEPRTLPEGPARRANPAFDPSRASGLPRTAPRGDRPAAMPRSYDPGEPSQSRPRGIQNPAYQPSDPAQGRAYDPARARTPQPRAYEPSPAAPSPSREAAPRASERPRSGSESPPAPRQPERAAPAERAPNRGEGRQPAGERAAPERAAPAERAAPRTGGGSGAAARPRGRGGSQN